MLERQKYTDAIVESLIVLSRKIEALNSLNLTDLSVHAEDFFCGLLNQLYGLSLKNVNIDEPNAASIDLGDLNKRWAIQVTADGTAAKVRKTVEAFVDRGLHEKYDRLVVLQIAATGGRNLTEICDPTIFVFDPREDIWDIKSLCRRVEGLSTSQLAKLADYLDSEFGGLSSLVPRGTGRRREGGTATTPDENLSLVAEEIAVQKDVGWQGLLFCQVLIDEIAAAKPDRRDLEFGITVGPRRHFQQPLEFQEWFGTWFAETSELVRAVTPTMEAGNAAVQESDIGGVVHAATRIGLCYSEFIRLSLEMKRVVVPSELEDFKEAAANLSMPAIRDIEEFAENGLQQCRRAVEASKNSDDGDAIEVELGLTLSEPNTGPLHTEMDVLADLCTKQIEQEARDEWE